MLSDAGQIHVGCINHRVKERRLTLRLNLRGRRRIVDSSEPQILSILDKMDGDFYLAFGASIRFYYRSTEYLMRPKRPHI